MADEIKLSISEAALRRELNRIPLIVSGKIADPYGYSTVVAARVGNAVLSSIQQAFIVKARGGTDESGTKWAPLKRETIAQRRVGAGTLKAAGITGRRTRGLLTPAQDRLWRGVYASNVAKFMLQSGPDAGRARAAALAWAIVKKAGGKTKLEVLGSRQVEIMRDTGVLFNSLSPGVNVAPGQAPGQVFGHNPGSVVVGTNVPYAAAQHARRRLWPEPRSMPASWLKSWAEALARGIALVLPEHLKAAARAKK